MLAKTNYIQILILSMYRLQKQKVIHAKQEQKRWVKDVESEMELVFSLFFMDRLRKTNRIR